LSSKWEFGMSVESLQTAETKFVGAAGIRFAYRRFGKKGGLPLVMCQHYTGNLDNRDLAVTDGFARDREVVNFNKAGIASSGGETPETVTGMAMHATAFVGVLGLDKIDLLGFSLGGFVAQMRNALRDDPKPRRNVPTKRPSGFRRPNRGS
jgi:pimeloyl-ACP methyl ester carboxylesterase